MNQMLLLFIVLAFVLSVLALLFILPPKYFWKYKIKSLLLGIGIFSISMTIYCFCSDIHLLRNYYSPQELLERQREKTLRPMFVEVKKNIFQIQNALFQKPEQPGLWWQLAKLYQVLQEDEQAIMALKKAYTFDQNNTTILSSLLTSHIQFNHGQIDEQALKWCKKLEDLVPSHPAAMNVLGFYANQQREFKQAKHYWEQALKGLEFSEQKDSAYQLIIRLLDKIKRFENAPIITVKLDTKPLSHLLKETDYIFITAKAQTDVHMPLAVKKIRANDVLSLIELSVKDAIDLNWTLADVKDIVIEAKVSSSEKMDDIREDIIGQRQPLCTSKVTSEPIVLFLHKSTQ